MKTQNNHKLVLAIVVAVTLLLVGISVSMNASTLEGRLKSVKNNPSMESMDEDELKPTFGMEGEETRELKPPKNGMEAENTDE